MRNRSSLWNRRGIALVITLAAVVLLTVLVVAFFTRALLNRQVAFTSTNMVKADILARASLDLVVGEIRQEMLAGSTTNTVAGVTIMQPAAASNMVISRQGVASADPDAGAYTIAKVSADNTPARPNGAPLGSGVRVSDKSANGRSSTQWFASGPNLGSASLPAWVYLGRNGVEVNPSAADARNRASSQYIIGRFAYTVYDTGGLLDANIAGFPSGSPYTLDAAQIGGKSSEAYADLTAIGLSAAAVNSLIQWRNAESGIDRDSFNEWATGIPRTSGTRNAAALAGPRSGYRDVTSGDQSFLSRRDLLRYAASHDWGTNAVNYLTQFSRASQRASWRPSTPAGSSVDYATLADNANSANRNLLGVRRTASGLVVRYSDDGGKSLVAFAQGDPLIARRFSLGKLAWLGLNGPNAAAFDPSISSSEREQAIQSCFGLRWNASRKRWDYVGSTGSQVQDKIKKLGEIAGEAREPNFFELLKAGLLDGSLGRDPGVEAPGPFILFGFQQANVKGVLGHDFDAYSSKVDLQVLQIGANIIDQADAGNYPTAIFLDFTPPRSYGEGDLYRTVYGVENLPYLSRLGEITIVTGDSAVGGNQTVSTWLQPELWNPHYQPAGYPTATGQNETPADLRIVTYGESYALNTRDAQGAANPKNPGDSVTFGTDPLHPSSAGIVTFTNSPSFFSQPQLLTTANAASPSSDNVYSSKGGSVITSFASNPFVAIWTGDVERIKPAAPSANGTIIMPDTHLTFALEYFDGADWRPYSLMSRVVHLTEQSYASGTPNGSWWKEFAARVDPRTDRFSISSGWSMNPGNWATKETIRPDASKVRSFRFAYPAAAGFYNASSGFSSSPANNILKFDQWAQNLPSSDFRYADIDGVTRPGDARFADYSSGDGIMLYHGSTQHPRRPVILNRPFRSVGELGFVFRDVPFKTLDLWSPGGGDSALLELFAVSDASGDAVAGKLNINSAPPKVIQSMLSQADRMPEGTGAAISSSEALGLADVISPALASTPATSRAALVENLGGVIHSAMTTTADKANKSYGETGMRALSSATDAGTWNLLVDLVAQTGRLKETATGLQDFIVEGEKRYWLHIAIDRFTGRIIDRHLEPVHE